MSANWSEIHYELGRRQQALMQQRFEHARDVERLEKEIARLKNDRDSWRRTCERIYILVKSLKNPS